ncbi:MAG TPA: hypothetical protein VHC69_20790 [Polyangiaceae bacterium]|nr:hypothetical protein [Polyangiaceae bacterium]
MTPFARVRRTLLAGASALSCHSNGAVPPAASDGASPPAPVRLELVTEKKLSKLLSGKIGKDYEASGVVVSGGSLYVAADDTTSIAVIDTALDRGALGPGTVTSSQYEAITATDDGRFYVMIETASETDLRGEVVELDASTAFVRSAFTDVTFREFNKGFEGLAWLRNGGDEYLLALCQNNDCKDDDTTPGKGRVKVLELAGGVWTTAVSLKLPNDVEFLDYSDLAIRANGDGSYTAAVVSHRSSALWIGTLTTSPWALAGPSKFYEFPPGDDGRVAYCSVEGVTFLGPDVLAFVSDKSDGTDECTKEEESIHIFKTPS